MIKVLMSNESTWFLKIFPFLLNSDHSYDRAVCSVCLSVCSSVQRFENMLNNFRIHTNPKQDTEAELPRQQEEPWLINDQDLERNKTKVWYWKKKLDPFKKRVISLSSVNAVLNLLCGFQSLRQIRLNEVLHDYSRDAALIVMWVRQLLYQPSPW